LGFDPTSRGYQGYLFFEEDGDDEWIIKASPRHKALAWINSDDDKDAID